MVDPFLSFDKVTKRFGAVPVVSPTDLAIGRNQDGRLELFYWAKGEEIWHNWQPRAGQGPWNPIVHYEAESVG